MRLALVALLAGLALLVAVAPAGASLRGCKGVSGQAGGAGKITLTKTFACADARRDVKWWLDGIDSHGPKPWKCTHRGTSVAKYRCHLRTSFGGTKKLRTYHLRFTFYDR